MGCQTSRAAALEKQVEDLDKQVEDLQRAQLERDAREEGKYWHRIADVWEFVEVSFDGQGSCLSQFQELRKMNAGLHNYDEFVRAFERSEGIEAELKEHPSIYSDGESGYTVVTADSQPTEPRKDNAGKKNHSNKHLKTFLGNNMVDNEKSKAHLIPKDPKCNQFWRPILPMVVGRDIFNTGSQVDASEKIMEPAKIMDLAAGLQTNKLVFDNEHNNYFDTLQFGNILAIPIFKSLELLGDWKYQEPYEMLVICDSHKAYQRLAIINTKGHIKDVTEPDVGHATDLLHMATRMLAESLVTNWETLYKGFDESEQKKRMKNMLDKLSKNQVKVPVVKENFTSPKLYKINFGELFAEGNARKYIPDPLLLLIKAAVNLSSYTYPGRTTKLLQACMTVASEDSGDTCVLNEIAMVAPQTTSAPKTPLDEIRVVSDDENDSASVRSDITCDE